jgi:hypothetical protein
MLGGCFSPLRLRCRISSTPSREKTADGKIGAASTSSLPLLSYAATEGQQFLFFANHS